MIKLIVCDLDGTILNDSKEIDPKLFNVIKQLRNKGIDFTIASGRSESLIVDIVDKLDIQAPYITNNGGNIYQKHINIKNNFLPKEYLSILFSLYEKYQLPFAAYGIDYVIRYLKSDFFKTRVDAIVTDPIHYDSNLDTSNLDIVKITCDLFNNPDCIDSLINDINNQCPNISFTKAEPNIYCANSIESNKGNAVNEIAKLLNISSQEVMAFGDESNDLSMLISVGYGIAMGNSNEEIKEKCDYVCKDNNHHGVTDFLIDYFNLEEE